MLKLKPVLQLVLQPVLQPVEAPARWPPPRRVAALLQELVVIADAKYGTRWCRARAIRAETS